MQIENILSTKKFYQKHLHSAKIGHQFAYIQLLHQHHNEFGRRTGNCQWDVLTLYDNCLYIHLNRLIHSLFKLLPVHNKSEIQTQAHHTSEAGGQH